MKHDPGRDNLPGVLALLTDFGTRDDYVGQLHGAALSVSKNLHIVDLCHEIAPGEIQSAAFLLIHDFEEFPEGTVFLSVVDPGVGTKRRILVASVGGRFVVAPDNGLLAPLFAMHRPDWIRDASDSPIAKESPSRTFHGRDVMAPVAAWLASGGDHEQIGPLVADEWVWLDIQPIRTSDGWTGCVVWIDRFGNLVTNLSEECLVDGDLRYKGSALKKVQTFADGGDREAVWLIGSRKTAEIVVNGGSAERILGGSIGDLVYV